MTSIPLAVERVEEYLNWQFLTDLFYLENYLDQETTQ